jgi:hypothetical protein
MKINDKKLERLLINRIATCRADEIELVKSELRACHKRLIEKQAKKDNKAINEKLAIS